MKYNVFECDNPKCSKTSKKALNVVTVAGSQQHRVFDLCDDCAKSLISIIESGRLRNGDAGTSPFSRPQNESKTLVEVGIDKTSSNEGKVKAVIKPVDKKSKGDKYAKCEAFGVDKLKDMYQVKGMSSNAIAELVGVPKTSLDAFFRAKGIGKKLKEDAVSDSEKEEH